MSTVAADKAADGIQQRITDYACALDYDSLTPGAVHAAKVRVIDTLGAFVGGFFAAPAHVARNLAAQMPCSHGATVIGTRVKTTPDMAAFVNGATAPFTELTDLYHSPTSSGGHPSDVVLPLLAAAEYAQASGRDYITSVVLAYEISLRLNDLFRNPGFDNINFPLIGTAVGAGKLLRLSREQVAHCISMAVVPNNALRVTREGHLSMWKVGAAGQAGRAGVFAALLAKAGMEGPHLPFEGKAGWCDHVARSRFTLESLGGEGTRFKILDTSIKMRPASAFSITAILAAEQLGPLVDIKDVREVTVEVYKKAKDSIGTSPHLWQPDSKETADHSLPYLIAVTLVDGKFDLRSFDDAHFHHPAVRALMRKIKVVENEEFTRAFSAVPVQQRARVILVTADGERRVAEAGRGKDDLATPKTDAQIEEKFRSLTEDVLGAKHVRAILERLWTLERLKTVAAVPSDFVIE